MEWQDEGIILHTQPFGENSQIVSLFTPTQGRWAGIFRGTQKSKHWLQCGNKVKARWGARLENHLGYWALDPLESTMAYLLDSPGPLAALLSAATLCHVTLPERQAYFSLYEKFQALLASLLLPEWAQVYSLFEFSLLKEMGYGLDLEVCAVTKTSVDLVAVSPRTGRAVCGDIAKLYEGRLLPLPPFIRGESIENSPKTQEILDALCLSGYFLERYVLGRSLPAARLRFLERLAAMRKVA